MPRFSVPVASSPDAPVAAVVAVAVAATATVVEDTTAAGTPGAAMVLPRARAALLFGVASPKPQPPSRCWAITAPAQRPVLKPQQPLAQSASLVQAPVMNWVPWVWARRATVGDWVSGVAVGEEGGDGTGYE